MRRIREIFNKNPSVEKGQVINKRLQNQESKISLIVAVLEPFPSLQLFSSCFSRLKKYYKNIAYYRYILSETPVRYTAVSTKVIPKKCESVCNNVDRHYGE